MSDSKKKRLSMLDSMARAGAGVPQPIMAASRPLRAARDAVEGHKVWDVDPADIVDDRIADRLDPRDVADLRDSIEQTGQAVPVLLRRHPAEEGKFLLVYGRRRLEAVRSSDRVEKIRALIATLDDTAAVEAQISENMARRDLSFIEKALFAKELVEGGFGTQSRVAEVLTVSKSAISMALAVVDAVGAGVIRAIGPAHGIGRPRWETLARAVEASGLPPEALEEIAFRAHDSAGVAQLSPDDTVQPAPADPSAVAFDAVLAAVTPKTPPAPRPAADAAATGRSLPLPAGGTGKIRRVANSLRLDISNGAFADWLEDSIDDVLTDLHARFKARDEDPEQ